MAFWDATMKLPLTPDLRAELADSNPTPDASLLCHFQAIPDFRREHGRRHLLIDILVIAACATVADCDGFAEMEAYGTDNEAWLRTFLELPNGVPSHDTFRRVFLHLDPLPFQRACVRWLRAAADELQRSRQPPCPPDGPAATTPRPATEVAGPAAVAPLARPTAPEAQPSPPPVPAPRPLARDLAPAPAPTAPALGRLAERPLGPAAPQPISAGARPRQPATPPGAEAPPPLAAPPAVAVESLSPEVAKAGPVAPSAGGPEGQRRHLAIDGKTARGSFDKAAGQTALHLVSVWATEERLTLAQVAVAAKSNEITAIPEVLRLVELAGAVVSIDAMGTQEAIVAQVREGGGDYLLAVKENQPHLYEDVVGSFVRHFDRLDGRPDVNELVVVSKREHGRKEKRTCVLLEEVDGIRDREKWRDVKRLFMVHRECEKGDGTLEEDSRYFIGSAASDLESYAKWVRGHWGIENQLHWVLDVIFHEDASRVRKDHGTENLATLRRLAVSLLGNDETCKRSIRSKRKKAARDNDYLARILLGLPHLDASLELETSPLA